MGYVEFIIYGSAQNHPIVLHETVAARVSVISSAGLAAVCLWHIIRSTFDLIVGLKCPSFRPQSLFDFNEIWHVGTYR